MKNYIFVFFILNFSISFCEIPSFLLNDDYISCKNDHINCSHSNFDKHLKKNELMGKALDTNLDVLKYDLYLDWSSILIGDEFLLENKIYSGIQTITFSLKKNSNKIIINSENLSIDSIYWMNERLENFSNLEGILDINFPSVLESSLVHIIKIYYKNNGITNKGFYLYPKGEIKFNGRDYFNYAKLAVTFSQPEMARNWMPCNDVPDDKAYARISVKVPEGYEVASNGLLVEKISQVEDTNNLVTFIWEDKNHPISTYLMVVHASKYSIIYDEYTKESTGEIIPILNYVWKEDSLGNFENGDSFDAINSLKNTPKIMKAFADMFGEYAYDKYGHATVQPFYFGGMEHQTITSINRTWLRGTAELGIAHEIGHHWIGDLITCETWQDIWINEGGATWFEALWIYAKYMEQGEEEAFRLYNKYFTDRSWRYLSEERLFDKILNQTTTNLIFNYSNLTYTKASWVYHMLYRRLEQEFIDFMSYLFLKYKHDNISTKEFENELSDFVEQRNIKFDAKEFFNQIVYKSGHPAYYIFMNPDYSTGASSDYRMIIEQAQNGIGFDSVYNYHLKIDCFNKGILDTSFVVFNNQRKQEYEISLKNKIDSAYIDRSYTLCNVWTSIVSVQTSEQDFQDLEINPNPISSGANMIVNIPNIGYNISLEIYDIMGVLKMSESLKNKDNSSILFTMNTNNFESGSYFMIVKSENFILNKKFIVIKN